MPKHPYSPKGRSVDPKQPRRKSATQRDAIAHSLWLQGTSEAGTPGAPGAGGATGATGATGAAGPAPAGTGFVRVTAGVLENPATVVLDTDGTLAANSDAKVASQKAVKTYADTKVPSTRTVNGHALSADVTVSKSDVVLGSVDNVQQLPLSYLDTDGTLAGNSDVKVASQKATKTYADLKIPLTYLDTDGTLAGNSDTKIASQKATKTYADLRTVGPSSSVASEIALFDGTTGKLLKRATGTGVAHVTSGVLSASNVVESEITLADNTTDDVTSTAHGFAPKSPADATKFLNGAATPAYAQVKDSDLSTTDITTNDATTSKHGFLQKLPGGATTFLRADGTFASPPGGAGGTGWTLITSFTFTSALASKDFTGLGGYEEILFIMRLVTTSANCTRFLRHSADNGSTFPTTTGNFEYLGSNGSETEDGTHAYALHDNDSSLGRSAAAHIYNWNSTSPKICHGLNRGTSSQAELQIWPIASALNALRILGGISGVSSVGNLNGGSVFIFGR